MEEKKGVIVRTSISLILIISFLFIVYYYFTTIISQSTQFFAEALGIVILCVILIIVNYKYILKAYRSFSTYFKITSICLTPFLIYLIIGFFECIILTLHWFRSRGFTLSTNLPMVIKYQILPLLLILGIGGLIIGSIIYAIQRYIKLDLSKGTIISVIILNLFFVIWVFSPILGYLLPFRSFLYELMKLYSGLGIFLFFPSAFPYKLLTGGFGDFQVFSPSLLLIFFIVNTIYSYIIVILVRNIILLFSKVIKRKR